MKSLIGTSWRDSSDGKVIEVDGDIIIVDFENFGIKKMLGSHHMLHKKG